MPTIVPQDAARAELVASSGSPSAGLSINSAEYCEHRQQTLSPLLGRWDNVVTRSRLPGAWPELSCLKWGRSTLRIAIKGAGPP